MSKKKIILSIGLVIVLITIGIIVFFEIFKTCGNCGKPLNNYRNYTITYSSSNGSLPPPYHKEQVFTASKDATGTVKAEYETKEIDVSSDQFDTLINDALSVGTGEPDSLAGCTGGTSKSLQISEGEKIIIDASSYNCAGKSTNKSLENFSSQVDTLLLN